MRTIRRFLPALSVLPALFALSLIAFGTPSARAASTINVTNQLASAYLFNGSNPNGTITLVRGQTYTFQVNATGHPFHITTAPGLPVQDSTDPGISGNGTASGPVTFAVSSSTVSQLAYQCGVHTAMFGTILVVNPPLVPAVSPLALALLVLSALGAGFLLLRKRARA
jgi:hypothetical protein